MSDQEHKWEPCKEDCGGWVCGFHGLEPSLQSVLNEHAKLKRDNERLEETNKGLFGIVETYHPGYIDGCTCPQCSEVPIYFDDDLKEGE